jgi:DNA-binding NarL/FixJ family response regulator
MMVTLRDGCKDTADKANFQRMANRGAASMIRVLLADDDQPFLEALSPLIERQPELAVVGQANDGLAAIELADELSPDAVVIDLHMPRLDGVTAVARLRRDHPSMCVIALTGDEAPALHQAVTEAGADAVLVKDEFVDVLVDRLAAARTGIS